MSVRLDPAQTFSQQKAETGSENQAKETISCTHPGLMQPHSVLLQVAPSSVGVPLHRGARLLQLAGADDGLDPRAVPAENAAQAEEGGSDGWSGRNGQDIDGVNVLHRAGPGQDRGQEVHFRRMIRLQDACAVKFCLLNKMAM